MEPFPDDVSRFIDGTVETIDQLEILSVLGARPDATWDAVSVAPVTGADAAAAASGLAALHARGLLAAERRGGGVVYHYGPATSELARAAARLLRLYRERPVSTIRAVYARQRRSNDFGPGGAERTA